MYTSESKRPIGHFRREGGEKQMTAKNPLTFLGTERSMAFQMALQRGQFVKRLRQAREAAGYTQQKAADQLGVSIKTFNRWEAIDGQYPRPDKYDQIAELFGVSREYLQGPAPQLEQSRLESIEKQVRENNIMLRAVLAHLGITAETLTEPPASLIDALGDAKPKRRKARSSV